MKLLALFALFGFLTHEAHAGRMKEIYTTVHEEIEFYYQASGDWNLVKVNNLEFVSDELDLFLLVTANATIRNNHTGKGKNETCLVTLERESLEFTSINCF